jgi:hypothetical protein
MLLADAYLGVGDAENARATFKQATKLDPSPAVLNNVAYDLAEKNLDLESARDYAERAVRTEEELSGRMQIEDVKSSDLGQAQTLATFWDTLGWVYFRLNDFSAAEKYLAAAWQVSQNPVSGQHLGKVYEKQGRKGSALHIYQLAHSAAPLRVAIRPQTMLSRNESGETPDADLKRLGGKPDPGKAVTELNEMRTVQLPRLVGGTASAEFYVVLGPGTKVDAKFNSGADSLKRAEKVLTKVNFKFVFPDDGPERIARKALLGCYPYSGCSIVLMMPSTSNFTPPLVP